MNNYLPKIVKIERIFRETADIKTLSLKHRLDFIPGQFLEISCFGRGEAPISIASGANEGFLKITFKRVGTVTEALFNLKEKDSIGIRGPFGNGFPLSGLENKSLLFIAGGIGIAPLRSLLKFMLSKKKDKTKDITLLYGARTPQDMLYRKELGIWRRNIKVLLTVDNPDKVWEGRTGVVTRLLNEVRINPSKVCAFICGPEVMMRFTVQKLRQMRVKDSRIHLSLERHMKCGIGKCGHCYIKDKFVCRDGPVFNYRELSSLIPKGKVL